MHKILLIDDMHPVRHAIAATLKKAGFDVVEAEDGDQGLQRLENSHFDLVITDIMMPASDGTDVVFALKNGAKKTKVVAISGGSAGISPDMALSLSATKADAVLKKPFENEELIETVTALVSQ